MIVNITRYSPPIERATGECRQGDEQGLNPWGAERYGFRLLHSPPMANHKRKRPKNRRAGCLLCKPHKANGVNEEKASVERELQIDIEEEILEYERNSSCV